MIQRFEAIVFYFQQILQSTQLIFIDFKLKQKILKLFETKVKKVEFLLGRADTLNGALGRSVFSSYYSNSGTFTGHFENSLYSSYSNSLREWRASPLVVYWSAHVANIF